MQVDHYPFTAANAQVQEEAVAALTMLGFAQAPSLVFGIPIIGYRLPDGSYLENSQLEPDIKVANSPETVVKGEDMQLKTAVDELLKEIDSQNR